MVTPNFAPKSNKSWTSKELEQLISLKNEGSTYKDIADHLGRTEKAVQVKLSKWNRSIELEQLISLKNEGSTYEEPFNEEIAALVDKWTAEDDEPKLDKPKHYLRNAEFAQKEQAKAMGARWDTKCWFVPDTLVGAERDLLILTFGPVMYGNHTTTGAHKWASFIPAELEDTKAKVQSEPDPGRSHVQAKPKRATQKKAQPVVESKRTVAVDTNVFTIRIPKRLVWGVLVSACVAIAWYVGKTY